MPKRGDSKHDDYYDKKDRDELPDSGDEHDAYSELMGNILDEEQIRYVKRDKDKLAISEDEQGYDSELTDVSEEEQSYYIEALEEKCKLRIREIEAKQFDYETTNNLLNDILNQYKEKGHIDFNFAGFDNYAQAWSEFWAGNYGVDFHTYYAMFRKNYEIPSEILPQRHLYRTNPDWVKENNPEYIERVRERYVSFRKESNPWFGCSKEDEGELEEMIEEWGCDVAGLGKRIGYSSLFDTLAQNEGKFDDPITVDDNDIYKFMQVYIQEHADYLVNEAKRKILEKCEEKGDQFNHYSFYFRGYVDHGDKRYRAAGFSDEQYAEALYFFDHLRQELLLNPTFEKLYQLECESCKRLRGKLLPQDQRVARDRKYYLVDHILRPAVMQAQEQSRLYHERIKVLQEDFEQKTKPGAREPGAPLEHETPDTPATDIGSHLKKKDYPSRDELPSKHTNADSANVIRRELISLGDEPSWSDVVRGLSQSQARAGSSGDDEIPRAGSSRDHEAQKGTDWHGLGDR